MVTKWTTVYDDVTCFRCSRNSGMVPGVNVVPCVHVIPHVDLVPCSMNMMSKCSIFTLFFVQRAKNQIKHFSWVQLQNLLQSCSQSGWKILIIFRFFYWKTKHVIWIVVCYICIKLWTELLWVLTHFQVCLGKKTLLWSCKAPPDQVYLFFREVQKAVNASQSLYHRWRQLLQDGAGASKEEIDWTTNELRNSLRSIEWDLEDLDETINILYGHETEVTYPWWWPTSE